MSDKNDENVDVFTVNGKLLSKAFGVTERRIRQMVDEGIIIRVKNGNYDLVQSVKNYICYINLNNESSIAEKKLNEQYLHEKAKREISEIKLASIKGEIHHTKDVRRVVTDMLINFKQKMRAIPAKIAVQINPASKTSTIESILKKEIDEALLELSEYKAEDYYSNEFIKIDEDEEFEEDEIQKDT